MPIYIAKYMYSDLYFEMKGVKAYRSLLDGFVVDLGLEMKRNSTYEEQRTRKILDRVSSRSFSACIYLVLKLLHFSPYRTSILQRYTNKHAHHNFSSL